MGTAKLMSFGRVEGCVNASEHHVGTAVARHFPNFIAAQRIGRVDADAHNVARLNLVRVCRDKGLVDKAGIAKNPRRRRCKHIQPARSDDRRTKRDFAWINEVNAHPMLLEAGLA